MRTKRNYIQMDRDMVEQFYHNTQKDIDEIKVKILNFETDQEREEEAHRVEVKVYLQKVKHLEYEQEKSNKEIELDGLDAKKDENNYFEKRIETMKKEKQMHKQELIEDERKKIDEVEKTQGRHQKELGTYKKNFDLKLQELEATYQRRLQKLKEDLELKLKVIMLKTG